MWIFSILFACGSKVQQGDYKLSPNNFEKKVHSYKNAQLVDVRTPDEYRDGYIDGAININYQGNNFSNEIEKLDKNKPTFIYCHSGGRSAESYIIMKNMGFKELYELEGGISNWQKEKKPVIRINLIK